MHVRRRSLNLALSAAMLCSSAPALAPRAAAQGAAKAPAAAAPADLDAKLAAVEKAVEERRVANGIPGLSLAARADAKRAEGFDVLKGRAELQLAGGPPSEIRAKVNETALKYQKLFEEAEELERQAERARSGQSP